jgi:hypothetical protein
LPPPLRAAGAAAGGSADFRGTGGGPPPPALPALRAAGSVALAFGVPRVKLAFGTGGTLPADFLGLAGTVGAVPADFLRLAGTGGALPAELFGLAGTGGGPVAAPGCFGTTGTFAALDTGTGGGSVPRLLLRAMGGGPPARRGEPLRICGGPDRGEAGCIGLASSPIRIRKALRTQPADQSGARWQINPAARWSQPGRQQHRPRILGGPAVHSGWQAGILRRWQVTLPDVVFHIRRRIHRGPGIPSLIFIHIFVIFSVITLPKILNSPQDLKMV